MKAVFRPLYKVVTLRHGPADPSDLAGDALASWRAEHVQEMALKIRPCPAGQWDLIGMQIPDAPGRPKADSKGREIATAAGPVLLPPDPAEQRRRATARMLARMALQVVDAFETAQPPHGATIEAWLAYGDALQAEMDAAGFVQGDVAAILIAMDQVNEGNGDLGNA